MQLKLGRMDFQDFQPEGSPMKRFGYAVALLFLYMFVRTPLRKALRSKIIRYSPEGVKPALQTTVAID